jgi:hypothetical protein
MRNVNSLLGTRVNRLTEGLNYGHTAHREG